MCRVPDFLSGFAGTPAGRSGFDPAEACEPAPEQLLRLLDYRDDRCRILFENIKLERTDSAVVIQGMAINAVLMR